MDIITQVNKNDKHANEVTTGRLRDNPELSKTNQKLPRWTRLKRRLFSCCYTEAVDIKSSLEDLHEQNENSHHLLTSPQSTTTSPHSSTTYPNDQPYLLPSPSPPQLCLVIDLDETLVHSSFKPIANADFIVPVEIDGQIHQVYVAKRPYVDEFLEKMGQLYECVLFTASLAKYADPVADLLDNWGVFKSRLFRESCVFHRGNYVKDLTRLGRDLQKVIIIDNSPASYIFHPDNAVPVASWFDDSSDTELLYLIPFFQRLASVPNVYSVLRNSNHPFNKDNFDQQENQEEIENGKKINNDS